MKKKLLALSVAVYCVTFSVNTQNLEYSALLIPKSLKENANAVVRNTSVEINVEDVARMTVTTRKVVTVLNKMGNVDARISESYDNDTKIKKLSALIYDAFGTEIYKFKERDFLDVSAVDGGTLYSDSRIKYVDYTPVSYPYTVVFESEYKTSSTGFIPKWFPVNGYYVSVEKSSYKLINPFKIKVRVKEKYFANYPIKNSSIDFELNYVLHNQPAIKYESESISALDFLPQLLVGLNDFTLKNVTGNAENWSEFGKWRYDYLFNGKDNLSEEIKQKVRKLVLGIENSMEKAKLIYEFMQNKTRYISVQEGIGGWKPIAANQVDKVGYGDCKGLTNYTKALLDAVGVESYYSVIWAGENQRNIEKDFFSMQGNHVILNIPNNGNDVWLECTSQTMPFGFLGDFTDDRNVLVITPEGGIIKRTPAYKDNKNSQITKAKIQLEANGNVKATLSRVSKGIRYDDKAGMESLSEDEITKYYKLNVWSFINNLSILSKEVNNNKDSIIFSEKVTVEMRDFATLQNNEYLFRVNVFNPITEVPKRYRNRKLPLEIVRGYQDVEDYMITLPEGYSVNFLPEPSRLSTKFGTFSVSLKKIDKKTIWYSRTLVIKSGVHPKEDYDKYRSFRRTIAKIENQRISLVKN